MTGTFHVTTFYKFFPLTTEEVQVLKARLEDFSTDIRGLIIIGTEGVNGTVSGEAGPLEKFKEWLNSYTKEKHIETLRFKDSRCDFHPFRMLKVKVRKEIVSLGNTDIVPETETDATHLSPEQWDEMLRREDTVCIDTRNWYETRIGKFKTAVDPQITEFQDFPKILAEMNIPKDKKLLMYCTGGIRCEKAVIDARLQGYQEVYQLDGGILNYLEKRPDSQFEGECFVFDNRVAVDQKLQPSKKYRLCPHCGQPSQVAIECLRCDTPASVCEACLAQAKENETCSKNCAYQYKLHPQRKGKKQLQGFRASLQMGDSGK